MRLTARYYVFAGSFAGRNAAPPPLGPGATVAGSRRVPRAQLPNTEKALEHYSLVRGIQKFAVIPMKGREVEWQDNLTCGRVGGLCTE